MLLLLPSQTCPTPCARYLTCFLYHHMYMVVFKKDAQELLNRIQNCSVTNDKNVETQCQVI